MKNKKKENSVKSLVNLYTVVIGVALSNAVLTLIDPAKGLVSITGAELALFAAFVATLVPFFHGALRHLDDAYIENDNSHIRDTALILDFLLLFLHALGFVALASLLKQPGHFAWVLVVLLAIDVIWGVFTSQGPSTLPSRKGLASPEGRWALLNFAAASLGAGYLVAQDISLAPVTNPFSLSLWIAIVCALRTVTDYLVCRVFYFPGDVEELSPR